MLKLKNTKKIIAISSIAIIIATTVAISFAYASPTVKSSIMKTIGLKISDINKSQDKVVAIVNGENIFNKQVEIIKASNQLSGIDINDTDIINSIIEKKLLFDDAIKNGIKITDVKVDEIVKSNQDAIKNNPEEYNNLKSYLSGLGIDENQYWENSKLTYKKLLVIGEYKNNYLKEKFKKESNITDKAELNTKFSEYYKNYVKELKTKSNIVLKQDP